MSPRIAPTDEPGPEAAELLARLPSPDGRPLNIFGTLAHHPYLLRRYVAMGDVFLGRGLVPAREREIVILRTAWRTRSVYEFGQHTRLGRQAGLSEEEIARVTEEDRDGWAAGDADLLSMVDELHAGDRVTDERWSRLAGRWSPAQLLELVALVGFYRMTAGILNSTGVEPEPGVPGWPADR